MVLFAIEQRHEKTCTMMDFGKKALEMEKAHNNGTTVLNMKVGSFSYKIKVSVMSFESSKTCFYNFLPALPIFMVPLLGGSSSSGSPRVSSVWLPALVTPAGSAGWTKPIWVT